MPNIASIFSRVARKEIRAEVDGLRKAVTQQHALIAALRRQVQELEKALPTALTTLSSLRQSISAGMT